MIQTKEKKCKGTGKASGNGCGALTLFRKYGLCQNCFKNWLLNTENGREMISRTALKSSVKVKKEMKQEATKANREQKEKGKSIAALILESRKPYQQWIRMRDANNSCISCGQITSEIWDSGHFKKAELYTGMIFDERNCSKQCRKCNTYLNGNEGEYRKRLIEKHSQEWMDELDRDSDRLRVYKWDREQLLEIKQEYSRRVKNKEI